MSIRQSLPLAAPDVTVTCCSVQFSLKNETCGLVTGRFLRMYTIWKARIERKRMKTMHSVFSSVTQTRDFQKRDAAYSAKVNVKS